MTLTQSVKLYVACTAVCFAADVLWLGFIAKGLYARQLGHLMRSDVQWLPAVSFYLIYVAALVVFVVQPAVDRQSLMRAVGLGAFFGLAAYAAFDLTGLALLKDFPVAIGLIDLAWGATLSAVVCGAGYLMSRAFFG